MRYYLIEKEARKEANVRELKAGEAGRFDAIDQAREIWKNYTREKQRKIEEFYLMESAGELDASAEIIWE